jgi:hypothetical protein
MDAATDVCDRFLFHLYGLSLAASGQRVLDELAPFLMKSEDTSVSPASATPFGTFTVFTYRLTPASADILRAATDRLYGWLEPALPQDLCFMRGAVPWLITLASDREALMITTAEEAASIRARVRGLKLRARPTPPGDIAAR